MAQGPVDGWGDVDPDGPGWVRARTPAPTGAEPPPPGGPQPSGGAPGAGRGAADVVDDTFRAVRGALPTLLVGAAATVSVLTVLDLLVLLPVTAGLSGVQLPVEVRAGSDTVWLAGFGEGATRLLILIGALLVSGVLSSAAAAGLAGAATGPRDLWQRVRPRLAPLVAVAVAVPAVVALGACLGALPGALVAALAGSRTAGPGTHALLDAGVLVGVALAMVGGFVGGAVALLWWGVRWSVAPQAVALEGLGARAALARSRSLTGGHYWRALAGVAFAVVITWVVHALVSTPFATVGLLIASAPDADLATMLGLSPGHLAVAAVGTVVAATASYPLLAAALTVLFEDLRTLRDAPGSGAPGPGGR